MEEQIIRGVETVGVGGLFLYAMKHFFKYLSTRSTRSDEREKDMIKLQREQQTIISNHLPHMTDAQNKLSHAIDNNTDATRAIVEVVDGCASVQEARNKAKN